MQSRNYLGPSVAALLSFWAVLLNAKTYCCAKKADQLNDYLPVIVNLFLTSRLNLASQVVAQPGDADCIGIFGDVDTQPSMLESIGQLLRHMKSAGVDMLLQLLVPLLQEYAASIADTERSDLAVLEIRIGALAFVVGMLAKHPLEEESDESDVEAFAAVIRLIPVINSRVGTLDSASGQRYRQLPLQYLEHSILHFLHCFRHNFLVEVSPTNPSSTVSHLVSKLRLAPSVELEAVLQQPQAGAQIALLGLFADKIIFNLESWSLCDSISDSCLRLFADMAETSRRQLLEVECVRRVVNCDKFPFALSPSLRRSRIELRRIVTSLFEDLRETRFSNYLKPMETLLGELNDIVPSNPSCLCEGQGRDTLLGLLYDLRGVLLAINSRRAYNTFFAAFFPGHIQTLTGTLSACSSDIAVEVALLRLFVEFFSNRIQRISFEVHSPSGVLLFRQLSSILQHAAKWLAIPPNTVQCLADICASAGLSRDECYAKYFKPVYLCLLLLHRGLSGNWVNLGVMELYGDAAYVNALGVGYSFLVALSFNEIAQYPKVAEAFMLVLEQLLTHHVTFVANQESATVMHLLSCLEQSLLAVSLPHQALTAAYNSIAALATTIATNHRISEAFEQHLQQDPQYFHRLLMLVISNAVNDDGGNQWTISQSILPILQLMRGAFNSFVDDIVARLPEESSRHDLRSAFSDLLASAYLREVGSFSEQQRVKEQFQRALCTFRLAAKGLI